MRSRTVNGLKIGVAGIVALAATTTLWARPDDRPGQPPNHEGPATRQGRGPGGLGGPGGPNGPGGDRDRDRDRPWGGFGFGRRGPGENAQNAEPATAEEWTAIKSFMSENSPVRLGLYNQIESENGLEKPVTQIVRNRIVGRYRDLQALKERNNEMYEFAFTQVKVEDKALGALIDLQKDANSETAKANFKEQMHQFVMNSLNERQARLAKLKELVAREEEKLAKDRGDVATLETNQQDKFSKDMEKMLKYAANAATTQPSDEK